MKMDKRHDYTNLKLQWEKNHRPPLPNLPREVCEALDPIKAERDRNERVPVDFSSVAAPPTSRTTSSTMKTQGTTSPTTSTRSSTIVMRKAKK